MGIAEKYSYFRALDLAMLIAQVVYRNGLILNIQHILQMQRFIAEQYGAHHVKGHEIT